jgi:quinol monooxygenase YgiN
MAEPVVVTAVFTPADGALDQLVEALSYAIAEVHEESGCLLYAIHSDPAGRIVMIEKWESAELLDEHGSGEPVKRLNAVIADLIAEPVEVTRLAPIPAGTPTQGQL